MQSIRLTGEVPKDDKHNEDDNIASFLVPWLTVFAVAGLLMCLAFGGNNRRQ